MEKLDEAEVDFRKVNPSFSYGLCGSFTSGFNEPEASMLGEFAETVIS